VHYIYQGILRDLTATPGGAYLPVFSPDGTRILFSTTAAGASAPDLYVVNIDGTGLRRLTNHPASDTSPTWSPGGQEIAFTSDRAGREQVYIMNRLGEGLRQVTREGNNQTPDWSN
jgi:TolB protein